MFEKGVAERRRFEANGVNAGKLFVGKKLSAAQQ
jgi:hypothetical protein